MTDETTSSLRMRRHALTLSMLVVAALGGCGDDAEFPKPEFAPDRPVERTAEGEEAARRNRFDEPLVPRGPAAVRAPAELSDAVLRALEATPALRGTSARFEVVDRRAAPGDATWIRVRATLAPTAAGRTAVLVDVRLARDGAPLETRVVAALDEEDAELERLMSGR